MCSGDRLVADFMAGADARPDLPEELEEQLTTTVDGLWVVWAHKLARQAGDLFVPLTGGAGYPADARAECRLRGIRGIRGTHRAPDPGCTCGFHALSSQRLPGLPVRSGFTALTVALSGRVLAFEWAGEGDAVAGGAADRGSHRAAGPVRPDGRSPGRAPPSRRSRRSPRCRPRCDTSRFGAGAAEPARLLPGAAGVPRRRRLVCGVQHVRALAGHPPGPGLARAVPWPCPLWLAVEQTTRVESPEIRYARSGDVHVAYGVVGDGPIDVVFVSGWVLSNFGAPWEGSAADFYRGVSSFARLVLFDKRGIGMSDRTQPGSRILETRMDDIRAVMDAAGSRRAAIMGFSEGGPMSMLFAATYPERTAALVLYSTPVSWSRTDHYPWAPTREEWRAFLGSEEGVRGTDEWCD